MPSEPTIIDAARRLVRHNGAVSVAQLGAEVADSRPEDRGDDEIRLTLTALPQIRWLDPDHKWLWLGARNGNRVLHAIEKVLSVARSIEIAKLCDGVRRIPALRDWWMPHDIVARLGEDANLCRRENTRLTATQAVREWRLLLGRYESAVVGTLREHGPTMTYDELRDRAAERAGLNRKRLSICLRQSPILEEAGSHGLRLRGTATGPTSPPPAVVQANGSPDPKQEAPVAALQGRGEKQPSNPGPPARPEDQGRKGSESGGAQGRPSEFDVLPRGRHGLPRETVAENQRMRILDAMVKIIAGRGYAEATISETVAEAHVSRKTFYELFADKDACFAAACERWLGALMSETRTAFESSPENAWADQAQLALSALLAYLAADPVAARTFVVEAAGAGPRAIARRDAAMRELAELADLGRGDGANQPPGITSLVLIGGLEELVRSRIIHGATAQLPNLLPDLLFCLIQPLLGTDVATSERERAQLRLAGGVEPPMPD